MRSQDVSVGKAKAPERSVAGEISYVSFAGDVDPWRLASVSLWRRSTAGTFIARANYANRFSTSGVQVEGDAYPRLSDKTYLYFNAGYSSATVFPAWRFGAEAFSALPGAWEASAGVRQLRFNGVPVTMLTGSVGKYVGNYWLSWRPYVRLRAGTTSLSSSVAARRYYEDSEHWVGVMVSYGSGPTERITPDAVARTHAFSLAVNGSTSLARRLLATWTIGRDAEELAPGSTRTSVTVTAGLKRSF